MSKTFECYFCEQTYDMKDLGGKGYISHTHDYPTYVYLCDSCVYDSDLSIDQQILFFGAKTVWRSGWANNDYEIVLMKYGETFYFGWGHSPKGYKMCAELNNLSQYKKRKLIDALDDLSFASYTNNDLIEMLDSLKIEYIELRQE